MDIAEALAAEMTRAGVSQYELAKRSGVPQPTIQRILSRETTSPKMPTVSKLAAALGVPIGSLVGGIQADNTHTRPAPNWGARPGFVPVIPLASVSVVLADRTSSPAMMATKWIPCPVNHGPRTFAYRVADDAMTAPAGGKTYPPGCFVYVDPDQPTAQHDKPVLARLQSGETILANYMAQAGRVWLRLLNPAYPPITEPFEVAGVVIFKGEEP